MNNREAPASLPKKASADAFFGIFEYGADRLLLLLLAAGLLLFTLWPMLCILLRSLRGPEGVSLMQYQKVWQGYRPQLVNSVTTAGCTALLCTVLSLAVALLLATQKGPIRAIAMVLLLMTLVSPPFVSSLAYIQLYGRRGWITYRLLGIRWDPYNRWGVILMQSMSFVPVNAVFLSGILSRTDTESLLSAKDLGAPPSAVLREIVMPLIYPGLLVSLLLSFVRSLADFGTPTIIGGRFSTLASEIYLQLIGYSDLEKASAMNMILLLPSVLAFFLYRRLLRRSDLLTLSSRSAARGVTLKLHRCGAVGWGAILLGGIYLFASALQYLCIFLTGFLKSRKGVYSFSLEHLRSLVQKDASTMLRSILYALIVAMAGTLFAMLLAWYTQRRKVQGRNVLDFLATVPYMIPGACFGIGYILAFNHAPLKLTGTAVIVLANMLFKQLPTGSKICAAALTQIPVSLEQAARDLGARQLSVWKDVYLPMLRPAFFSCFAYNFSSSMTTAGAILFLVHPGRKLAVFQLFDAVYVGEYARASLLATGIILVVLAVEGAAALLIGKVGDGVVS